MTLPLNVYNMSQTLVLLPLHKLAPLKLLFRRGQYEDGEFASGMRFHAQNNVITLKRLRQFVDPWYDSSEVS